MEKGDKKRGRGRGEGKRGEDPMRGGPRRFANPENARQCKAGRQVAHKQCHTANGLWPSWVH